MRSGEERDYVTAPSLGDGESEERVRRELRNSSRSYGESARGAPLPVGKFFQRGGAPFPDDSPYLEGGPPSPGNDLDLLRNSPHSPHLSNLVLLRNRASHRSSIFKKGLSLSLLIVWRRYWAHSIPLNKLQPLRTISSSYTSYYMYKMST